MRIVRNLALLTFVISIFGVAFAAAPVQVAEAQGACSGVVDIALVADVSGSIGSTGAQQTRDFFNAVVDAFVVDASNANFAIVGYESVGFLFQALTGSKPAIQAGISSISSGGGTNMQAGMEVARNQLVPGRAGVPKIMIVTSDGDVNAEAYAAQLKANDGIIIFTVGVGGATNVTALRNIASQPSYYVAVTDFGSLGSVVTQLVSTTCAIGGTTIPVAGCALNIPAGSVVGAMPFGAHLYWAPGKVTSPLLTANPGSYWVIGQDASETYYQIVIACQLRWVPKTTMGPYSDGKNWFNNPLPTRIIS